MINLPVEGRFQGGDQSPLALIALVKASKSETWIFVLCLRTYFIKGELIRGTKKETGSQVSWEGA